MAPSPSGFLRRFFGSAVSNAAGFAIGGAVQPVLEPLTQNLANEAWEAHPVRPLSPAAAARAAQVGALTRDEAESEAAMSGMNAERLSVALDALGEAPGTEALLDLRRRGVITDAELDAGLRRGGMHPSWRGRFAALRRYLIPPSDLIRLAVREVYSPAQRRELDLDAEFPDAFAERALLLGIEREDARDLWAGHWQLPSYEQLAEMLFRGELGPEQFRDALKALDYAPTWRGKLETIARRIPTVSDMIRLAVREVYDPAKRAALGLDDEFPAAFAREVAKHGMSDEHARDLWAGHWRLPSATQGYQMLWRGEIELGELDTLLKALDYPTKWRDRLRNVAYHVPGRIDLRRMYAAGIIDRERVNRGYRELGYDEENAEILTRFTVALAETAGEADKWADRARSRLYTVAHDEYLDRSIDEAKARATLTELGVAGAELDEVLRLWALEQGIARLELTPAQIRKAYTKGAYTREEAFSELRERGLSADDADTLLES